MLVEALMLLEVDVMVLAVDPAVALLLDDWLDFVEYAAGLLIVGLPLN